MPPPIPRPRSIRRAAASQINRADVPPTPGEVAEALDGRYDLIQVLGALQTLSADGLITADPRGCLSLTPAGYDRWHWPHPDPEDTPDGP